MQSTKHQDLLESSSVQVVSFQGCREDGASAVANYEGHCAQKRFPYNCGDLAKGENVVFPGYPPEIRCWSSGHSVNLLSSTNIRRKDAEGHDLLYIFGLRFNIAEYIPMLMKYNWDARQKVVGEADLENSFIDFDFGIAKWFGKHQIQTSDKNRCKIEDENLSYAASLPTLGKDTRRRLGPPRLTASQAYTQASWLYHVMAPRPERRTVWPHRDDDAQHNCTAGPADPKGEGVLETWLKIPPSPKPCFHPAFPYFNNVHEHPFDQNNVIPHSPDELYHIPSPCMVARHVERINSWYHGKKYKYMPDDRHKQLRRRQVEDEMTCPKKRRLFLFILKK